MRRSLALAICSACLSSAAMAADVGLSIQFSQPGVFGRVDVGQYPQPQLIVSTPIMIERPPPAMPPPEPLYLWVPPEHRQHWERYCREYHACGHPVYFVNHDWYNKHVLARDARPEVRHEDERYREHAYREEEHGHHDRHDEEDHGRGRE